MRNSGAPSFPSLNLPLPVTDLTASRRGNRVDLEWTQPRKTTDRTNIKHNPITRICRHEGMTLMAHCALVAEVTPPTPKPAEEQKNEAPPGAVRIHYVDPLPPQLGMENPAGFVTYGEEVNTHGRSAGLSNQVAIPVVPTIAAPDEVTARSVQTACASRRPVLRRPRPRRVTYRYRIMRRPVGAPAYVVLEDVAPAAPDRISTSLRLGAEISNSDINHAQANGVSGSVEGDDSTPAEDLTRDIYPPAQPAGLQAVFSSVGQKPFIDLTWAPNIEATLPDTTSSDGSKVDSRGN